MKLFEGGLYVKRRTRWVEDAAPVEIDEKHGTGTFIGAAVGGNRIILFGVIGIIFLATLLVRVMQLQLVQGDEWRILAERNRLHLKPILPERGIIYDRNMVPLVTNVPNFRLTLRAQDLPRDAKKRDEQIREIGNTVGVPSEKIDQVLEAFSKYKYSSVVIKEPVSYDEAVNVYLRSGSFPSLTIERGAKRKYVVGVPGQQAELPEGISQIMGYLARISPQELEEQRAMGSYSPSDVIGKIGIESAFESILRGVPGERGAEVDSHGSERGTVSVQRPIPGGNLVLTIDVEVQRQLESALKLGLDKAGQQRGAAIAVDPRDGSILGIASAPSYNDNIFADSISGKDYAALATNPNQPMVNRAIAGQFPAGSTIKPFLAAAALQEGVVTPSTTIMSNGGLHVGNWFFPDWKAGGHGATDVRKAIAMSVNTYFYTIGGGYGAQKGLGPERIKQYLEYFGFSKATGIDVPGEASGFLPSPAWKREKKNEQWYIGDTYNISIGQGDIIISPLQLAMGIAAIANGGTLYEPRVVSQYSDADGVEHVVQPKIRAKVPIDAKWLQVVQEGMRQAVTGGSAQSLKALPLTIAGKTGTAQWSSTKAPHAWFESYAPYEHPEIVTIFLVEEGKEGSSVSVPAARQFYTWWAGYRTARAGD